MNVRRAALLWVLPVALFACSERLDWREFRSPDGYTVVLPGRSQTVTREVVVDGNTVPMSMTSTGVGPAMFAVGVARLPAALADEPAARDRTIAYFRDGLVRNIGGTVTASGPTRLVLPSGSKHVVHAAQEVKATGRSGPDGRPAALAARLFIVDDRLYQVIALGGEGSIPPQALDTFFTSFQLQP